MISARFQSAVQWAVMSYQMYTTDAVVVGSFDNNLADRSYLLFTQRAGLVYAAAKSAREERSRQRYALQDFSHITVSLVRGKTGWRIGSVTAKQNFFMAAESRAARGTIVKLAKVLRRYVQGEEPQPDLYATFLEALTHLSGEGVVARGDVELCAIVRLLTHLGYIAPAPEYAALFAVPLPEVATALSPAGVAYLDQSYTAAQAVSHLER